MTQINRWSTGPSRLLHWAASATPGRGLGSWELPRSLKQWGASASPGLGWGRSWNPRDRRGWLQRGCRAQHLLCSPRVHGLSPALRGLRCIPISEMGKLRPLLRPLLSQDPRPHQAPALGQALYLAGRGFRDRQKSKVQASCVKVTGSHARSPYTPGRVRSDRVEPQLQASC